MNFTDYLNKIIEELSEKETYGLDDIKETIINANYGSVEL